MPIDIFDSLCLPCLDKFSFKCYHGQSHRKCVVIFWFSDRDYKLQWQCVVIFWTGTVNYSVKVCCDLSDRDCKVLSDNVLWSFGHGLSTTQWQCARSNNRDTSCRQAAMCDSWKLGDNEDQDHLDKSNCDVLISCIFMNKFLCSMVLGSFQYILFCISCQSLKWG